MGHQADSRRTLTRLWILVDLEVRGIMILTATLGLNIFLILVMSMYKKIEKKNWKKIEKKNKKNFSIFFFILFQSLNIQYDAHTAYLFWCLSKRWHLMQSFNPTNISIHIEFWEIEKKNEKKNWKKILIFFSILFPIFFYIFFIHGRSYCNLFLGVCAQEEMCFLR